MGPLDGDISGDFLKNPLRQDELLAGTVTPWIPSYPSASPEGSSPDSDLEFVASTKARVRELEQEAERLEKAFQNYHQRVNQCPAKSPLEARSPSLLHLLGNLKNILPSAPDRGVFPKDRVASQQPQMSERRKDKSEVSEVTSSAACRSRKGEASRRLSSTPVRRARRSLDGEMFLEGKLLLRVQIGWCPGDLSSERAAKTAEGHGSWQPSLYLWAPGEPSISPALRWGGGSGMERRVQHLLGTKRCSQSDHGFSLAAG